MREDYWQLMADLLPVLQPLQIVTELMSADSSPSASMVYPLLFKLTSVDLAVAESDSATVADFKRELINAVSDRFAFNSPTTAKHPFIVASVVDPATKTCNLFPAELRNAAYNYVRTLSDVHRSTPLNDTDAAADSSDDQDSAPPQKRQKLDNRTATLKFLTYNVASSTTPDVPEFERYISAPAPSASDGDVDALKWWASNERLYPATAMVARQFLSVPATSCQSERQFSAAGRLISKLRTRLDGDRVDTLIFLYKNLG